VFLTRPEGRNGSVLNRLAAQGMGGIELPALALRPTPPPLRLPPPDAYDLIVFVSRYAAKRYLGLLAESHSGTTAWPRHTIAATVGPSSAQALLESGCVPPECILYPSETTTQDSEALLATLQEKSVEPQRVLIVRGTRGRGWLADQLSSRGAKVEFLPVYERAPAHWPEASVSFLREALKDPAKCIFLLTSSEGVQAIANRLDHLALLEAWSQAGFVVIHQRIAATLQSVLTLHPGQKPRIEFCMPDDDAIVETIRAVADARPDHRFTIRP